ncbi:DUF2057 family protein [Affinibrenneria salicis]|nr:DUF2057 family protein [Affinibrenneria salicis]
MKHGFVAAGFLVAAISTPAVATTLKLSPEIELMIVDGRQLSGSLFKGADSLELDNGQHQILFKVVSPGDPQTTSARLYQSQPLITTFNTQNLTAVSIRLPALGSAQERRRFDKNPRWQLVDQQQQAVQASYDRLNIEPDAAEKSNPAQLLAKYNASGKEASVAAFVNPRDPVHHSKLPDIWSHQPDDPLPSQPADIPDAQNAESLLHYWFQQADRETQQRFLNWARDHQSR